MLGGAVFAFVRGSRRVPSRGWGTSFTSKRGNKKFYKGRGAESTGAHTHTGHFQILPYKRPNYIIPDLTGFEVSPSLYKPLCIGAQ